MSKRKGPPKITQHDADSEHSQIIVTKYSDIMSTRRTMAITIPPLGGDIAGVSEAIAKLSTDDDDSLHSWDRLKVAIDFDYFDETEPFFTKAYEHHGPVQRPAMFTEQDFKYRAYLRFKQVIKAIDNLPEKQIQFILDELAPVLVAAGQALAEVRIREAQLENVVQGERQLNLLRENAAKEKGPRTKTKNIVSAMDALIAKGKTKSDAARKVKKDKALDLSVATILRYHQRYKEN